MSIRKLAILIATKIESIRLLGKLVKSPPDSSWYVGNAGRYILMHFDLVTSQDKVPLDRWPVYNVVRNLVASRGGGGLSGTVFAVPVPDGQRAIVAAVDLWNEMRRQTSDALMFGDTFYVHYSADTKNCLGGLAQVVPKGERSLAPISRPT